MREGRCGGLGRDIGNAGQAVKSCRLGNEVEESEEKAKGLCEDGGKDKGRAQQWKVEGS